jgi:hypothetical protein
MKKYTQEEIENNNDEVGSSFQNKIEELTAKYKQGVIHHKEYIEQVKKQAEQKAKELVSIPFVKATDKYLKTLKLSEVEVRTMEPTDEHYINGFTGLFEKKTNKLLRRHSDRGWLSGLDLVIID